MRLVYATNLHLSSNQIVLIFLFLGLLHPTSIFAQENKEEFAKAIVLNVIDGEQIDSQGNINPYQKITARLLEGDEKNKEIQYRTKFSDRTWK